MFSSRTSVVFLLLLFCHSKTITIGFHFLCYETMFFPSLNELHFCLFFCWKICWLFLLSFNNDVFYSATKSVAHMPRSEPAFLVHEPGICFRHVINKLFLMKKLNEIQVYCFPPSYVPGTCTMALCLITLFMFVVHTAGALFIISFSP